MAKQIKLSANARLGVGRNSVKKIRAAGQVPAVIYGSTQEAMNLQLASRQISDVLAHATGEQVLVELEISSASGSASKLALIQNVQHHPVRGDILHVDFHAVAADEKMHAHVVVETVGESVGVKTFGGLLVTMLHSIEVECLPKDLPERIVVDVSALNLNDAVHLRDLKLPSGVSFRGDGDVTVLRVTSPNLTEVAPSTEGPTQPEVLREKKPAEGTEKK
jgi:large subunit ribosomal protein L25